MKIRFLLLSFLMIFFLFDSILSQNNAIFHSINDIKKIQIKYDQPYFKNPILLFSPGDSIPLTNGLINFTPLNNIVLSDKWKKDYIKRGRKFKTINKEFSDYINLDQFLLCLFSERYRSVEVGRFDLLIFKKTSKSFSLLGIYPESFECSFFLTPKIYHIKNDSLKIGGEFCDEGSIGGYYKYIILKENQVVYYRQETIQGHCNMGESGNPKIGVNTRRFINTYISETGDEVKTPIYYSCIDKNEKSVYGTIVSDSLSLYELFWAGIGQFIRNEYVKQKKIKVGELFYKYGEPFIAIEYKSKWYWVPSKQIKL